MGMRRKAIICHMHQVNVNPKAMICCPERQCGSPRNEKVALQLTSASQEIKTPAGTGRMIREGSHLDHRTQSGAIQATVTRQLAAIFATISSA
mmetsp:Transcript_9345/g.28288  ORF Transcript_9345/g.28288 Transcript_9345/m.28288 type:complete len:93 (-) Transcript_9345:1290-1568(-)